MRNCYILTHTLAYSALASTMMVKSFQRQPLPPQKALRTKKRLRKCQKNDKLWFLKIHSSLFSFSINNNKKSCWQKAPLAHKSLETKEMLRKCQKDENSNFLTYTLAYSAEASMTVVQSFQQQPPLAQKSLETYEKVKEKAKVFTQSWKKLNLPRVLTKRRSARGKCT